MSLVKGSIVKVRDVEGRIIGTAKVGNYYPGTNKYQISFLYPTGESEQIDVPGWCLVVEAKGDSNAHYRSLAQ